MREKGCNFLLKLYVIFIAYSLRLKKKQVVNYTIVGKIYTHMYA